MAKVQYSCLVNRILGLLGSSIYQRYKGTDYIRTSPNVWTNPNSYRQQQIRGNFKQMQQAWDSVPLSHQELWHGFASKKGCHYFGHQAYVSLNCNLLNASHADLTCISHPPLRPGTPKHVQGFCAFSMSKFYSCFSWTKPDSSILYVTGQYRLHRGFCSVNPCFGLCPTVGYRPSFRFIKTVRSDISNMTLFHDYPINTRLYFKLNSLDKFGRKSPVSHVIPFRSGGPFDSISFGSKAVFNSAVTNYVSCVFLDNTHFVLSYRDDDNSYYGTAVLGTVSGTNISFSNEFVFYSSKIWESKICKLDSTHFVVVFRAGTSSSSYKSVAIVGTVSGNSLSFGSSSVCDPNYNYSVSGCSLNSTHFIITFRNSVPSNYGKSCVGTITGTSISWGSKYDFNTAATSEIYACKIDSTHFIIAFRDYSGTPFGSSVIGTVSGTTISFGSLTTFNTDDSRSLSVALLDSTHFVLCFRDIGNSDFGTSIIGTISVNSISYGSKHVFNTSYTDSLSVDSFDSINFVVSYRSNSLDGASKIGSVNNSSILLSSGFIYNSGNTPYNWTSVQNSSQFVVSYRDSINSDYGTSVIGYLSG